MKRFLLILAAGLAGASLVVASPAHPAKLAKTRAAAALKAYIGAYWDETRGQFRKHKDKDEVLDFWLAAHSFDLLLDARHLFPSTNLDSRVGRYYAGFKATHDDWRRNEFNDDLEWWIISLSRAAVELKDRSYLSDAKGMADKIITSETDGVLGGGVWWRNNERKGKHACSNFPAVIALCELHRATRETRYLAAAERIYAWARSHLVDGETGAVWDNISASGHVDKANYTYNNGTLIGAALRLHAATRRRSYLDDARLAADYLLRHRSNEGVIHGGGQGDGGAFNGIAMRYLAEYARRPEGRDVKAYLETNAASAWMNRRRSDTLCGPDWRQRVGDDFDIEGQTAASAVTLFLALAGR
ncbi:MAG: glycoside hydrolase family 76 protein [Kiritimatiellia bacterium]